MPGGKTKGCYHLECILLVFSPWQAFMQPGQNHSDLFYRK
ncbi:hypothetical protein AB434_0098 [Heyndrickxia coagulans]|uniref:Uncharacterized protein n=1 Tax=Heyndrickxia coagulans TaxID=1398 RepID=A0AAN0T4D7_HEYCO|nr:hypothetical protein SB48_HM08orf01660 [Heyndrickxia coagulans]AKN52503.1 hypothetical protein AB434_0098 [Heyndrickxia coagulans]KYC58821.1 hypothetical protein B4100_2384 [Heyndrickxia coagulans]KYC79795.1 hypothetical protein B4096_2280 [Heyndrickxia coagulans]